MSPSRSFGLSHLVLPSLALVLAVVLGYMLGRVTTLLAFQRMPLELREDARPSIPVIRIDGREGNAVVGNIQGNARLFLGDEPLLIGSGTFRFPFSSLRQVLYAPPGAAFVASKNGTKYYPLKSAGGEGIAPENRVYFGSAEEAEQAGYHR